MGRPLISCVSFASSRSISEFRLPFSSCSSGAPGGCRVPKQRMVASECDSSGSPSDSDRPHYSENEASREASEWRKTTYIRGSREFDAAFRTLVGGVMTPGASQWFSRGNCTC